MPHVVNLYKILNAIQNADRPSCLWLTKKEAVEIITHNATKVTDKIALEIDDNE